MSILPSNANQGSSSSSSCASPNPSNHGLLSQQPRQAGESQLSPSTDLPDIDSLRISGPEPSSTSTVNCVSDSVEQVASVQHIGAASKKVRGYRRSYINNRSSDQETHPRVEHSTVSGKEGFIQNRAEASGTSASPPNQRGNGSGGRRSQMMNGNHLLNFHYDPISRRQPTRPLPAPRKSSGKFKPYNKDLFLQANYKFVVLDTGNYDLESMDPDKMLQWEDIICLKYSTPYPVNCPICLESPLCAQITSCGHVFCFPCILRYLLMGEDNLKRECWKKCPLCFVMISSRELHTIDVENVKLYRTGDELEFVLLTREKNSFALQQNSHEGAEPNPRSCDLFSKFILTSDVNLSVRNSMSDLDGWLARADAGLVDDMEKLPYVCAAMDQLEKRKNYWNERRLSQGGKEVAYVNGKVMDEGDGTGTGTGNGNSSSDSNTPGRQVSKAMPDVSEPGSFVNQTSDFLESSPSSDLEGNIGAHVLLSTNEKDSYHFYQAVDGQHIILHPLNMKCLLHHYGSNEQLPTRLSGKILELETVTQSEAIRKRYRFLSHFPLTATFQFCEVDLSNIIPVESLSPFVDLIKKREKQREQLARKEHREKVKAEAVDAYYAPSSNYRSSYINDEPAFSMDDFEALGGPVAPVLSPPAAGQPAAGQRSLFASVARLGFAAGYDSPSLNSESQSGTNIESSRSGSSVPSGSTTRGGASFSSIISREPPVESRPQPKAGEMGKKGKKPSRVLLSTSGGRRY